MASMVWIRSFRQAVQRSNELCTYVLVGYDRIAVLQSIADNNNRDLPRLQPSVGKLRSPPHARGKISAIRTNVSDNRQGVIMCTYTYNHKQSDTFTMSAEQPVVFAKLSTKDTTRILGNLRKKRDTNTMPTPVRCLLLPLTCVLLLSLVI